MIRLWRLKLMVKLLQVFRDIELTYTAKSRGARRDDTYYRRYRVVPLRGHDPLTLEKLEEYLKNLQERFPDRGFYLKEKIIDGRRFYILSQKTRNPDGKKKKDVVSIYFDLAFQRVYVPYSYWRNNKRLTTFILHRVLGALGLATTKHESYVGRFEVS
jgi:hypothetical protein